MKQFLPVRSSRRAFIQKGTLALGAATFGITGSKSHGSSFIETRRQEKLGYALVGLGSYATYQLAPALQETQHCYLAGIVTGTEDKVETWIERYQIPEKNVYNYENYDQIADNPDIDVVYVVLPNFMHAEYSIRAAEAGKHVLCEKPMAISVQECEMMIEAFNKADRKLAIGYRLHYEPHNLEAMRLGQQRVFGHVKLIEAGDGFRIGRPDQWRLKKELAGGGALMDVGIYAIQAARYVTGEEPTFISAKEFKTDPVKFREVDETILWQMGFPSGTAANCSTSYATQINRLYAAAEEGWFEISPAYTYDKLSGRTHEGPMQFENVREQALHMDDFALSIINDRPVRTPGEMGLQDMKIIEAIYQSIASGETVELA